MKQILTFITLLISIGLYSQSITIDLSKSINETYKKTLPYNKNFNISLVNKLPLGKYNISITKKITPIEALKLPSEAKEIKTSGGGISMCARFIQEVYTIYELEKEEELPTKLKLIEKEILALEKLLIEKDVTDEGCTKRHISDAREIIELTRPSNLWEGSLKRGEQLEIMITRAYDGETRVWNHVYTTEPRGEWQISYGFSFIFQGLNKESLFFTSPKDSTYIIKKENNRKSMNFAPSILFSWIQTQSLNKPWNIGLSGGLGFDFENPTVFLSPTLSYNQNLKIHIGLVVHKQSVLFGKYDEGQILNENLSRDQLHEQLYKLNPFVSISFRFNQNPFKQQD